MAFEEYWHTGYKWQGAASKKSKHQWNSWEAGAKINTEPARKNSNIKFKQSQFKNVDNGLKWRNQPFSNKQIPECKSR